MSIINKMLQELEQRHAEDPGTRGLPGQLRAVPHERNGHTGWLAAAVLAVLLVGLLGWLWLRPAPTASESPMPLTPHLALKIESAMPEMKHVEPEQTNVESAKPEAIETMPSEQTNQAEAKEANAIDGAAAEPQAKTQVKNQDKPDKPNMAKPALVEAIVAGKSEPMKIALSEPAKPKAAQPLKSSQSAQSATNIVPAPTATPETFAALDKQIRPLTPQQRAENDYRRATGLAEQGRVADAVTLLEQVLQDDSTHAGARQTLIALLLKSKRQDEAARRAKEGLDIDVKQAGFAMILARLQVEKGDQQVAIATLQRTLPYVLDRPDYRAFLAALLQREERHKEAIEQYLLAVRLAPQNGVWWMGLGISMQADHRPEEAREAFSRARETSALSPELQAFVEQKLKQLSR